MCGGPHHDFPPLSCSQLREEAHPLVLRGVGVEGWTSWIEWGWRLLPLFKYSSGCLPGVHQAHCSLATKPSVALVPMPTFCFCSPELAQDPSSRESPRFLSPELLSHT